MAQLVHCFGDQLSGVVSGIQKDANNNIETMEVIHTNDL